MVPFFLGIGGFVNSTESVILSLVGDASHPQFKSVQQIIKQLSPDTGLLHGWYEENICNSTWILFLRCSKTQLNVIYLLFIVQTIL